MELLNIWAITVIVNFFYRIKTNVEIYKAYADLGYIYNGRALKFIEEEASNEDDDLTWFLYKFGKFIPLYNLYQSLTRKFALCIDAKENIETFKKCFVIEKMTKKEKEIYNKKKSGLYAIKMRRKINRMRNKNEFIICADGSSILYEYKYDSIEDEDLMDSIIIIEARGNLENKKQEELKKYVYYAHLRTVKEIINQLGILFNSGIEEAECIEENNKSNNTYRYEYHQNQDIQENNESKEKQINIRIRRK